MLNIWTSRYVICLLGCTDVQSDLYAYAVMAYRIQPNYRTVRIGFSKMLGKLVVKYVPTYTKGTLLKKTAKRLIR